MKMPTIKEVHEQLNAATTDTEAIAAIKVWNWAGFQRCYEANFARAVRLKWPNLEHLVDSSSRTYTGD